MLKILFVLQTILFSLLPSSVSHFNISNGPATATPAVKAPRYFGRIYKPQERVPFGAEMGKVIKEQRFGEGNYKIKTIVIDPGHGGHDPGCLGGRVKEKHIALAISKYLAQYVQEAYPDVKVILTRDADVFIPLHKRAQIANSNDADLFISVHCNSMPRGVTAWGTETYVLGQHRMEDNMDVAMRENASILLEDNFKENYNFDPNSPEAHIILSMFQNAYLDQSILFAEKVENRMVTNAARKSRGVKQAGFLVLRETAMPSVLIETGFLSHSQERGYLNTQEGQLQTAQAILAAFTDYKREMEGEKFVGPLTQPLAIKNVRVEDMAATFTEKSIAEAPEATTTEKVPEAMHLPKEKGQVQFRVQLAASPQPLDTSGSLWQNAGYLIQVIEENTLFKYQAVHFTNLADANQARRLLRERGFQDAFVVAYHGQERISLQEANSLLETQ